jgi:hypothetical protein
VGGKVAGLIRASIFQATPFLASDFMSPLSATLMSVLFTRNISHLVRDA